jgi:hypothetical protein
MADALSYKWFQSLSPEVSSPSNVISATVVVQEQT